MLLLGHAGITLGAEVALDRWLAGGRYFNIETREEGDYSQGHLGAARRTLYSLLKEYSNVEVCRRDRLFLR